MHTNDSVLLDSVTFRDLSAVLERYVTYDSIGLHHVIGGRVC